MEGWYRQKIPVVEIEGGREPEKLRPPARPLRFVGRRRRRQRDRRRDAARDRPRPRARRGELRRSVRIAWWPGHSTGRYAGSTWYADAFAIDLDENCVAQIDCDSPGCRWATSSRTCPG
jgi:N-acetylated-alpha-linked acidic dipeptidase